MYTTEELARFPLLADLTESQLERVGSLGHTVTFATGHRIIEEGRPADRCWLIRSGRVALQTPLPNNAASTVQTLGPGDVLGWSWLLAPYRWRFDGVATEPVEAIEIDAVQLREFATHDCRLGYPLAMRLLEALADRLHGTRARLIDMYGSPRAS
ncbi:MAG TPA: cyclic nucleotide-binding domain-containing protein [Jatrophihabitans sp.]|jgi:CRP-like cAMP-binding protein|nr:cyclic nucleotide-binding domain-containing protein [Jatrophihabitans sp.]